MVYYPSGTPRDDRAWSHVEQETRTAPPFTVDVHNHFVPPELVRDARAGGGFDGMVVENVDGREWVVHRQGYRYPLDPAFHDVEARLAAMDAMGVDAAVVSIAPTLFFYWSDAGETADFCRSANDALAAWAEGGDGRLAAVATLPMQDPGSAVDELRRAVGELGMCGAEIGPRVEERQLDDPDFAPVLSAAEELGVPLILHPYYVGSRTGLEEYYLTNLVGNPLATCICAARLIFSGTLDRLPGLELVLMHGGGHLPYQIGRLDHGYRVRPESNGCEQPPSRYLGRFTYDTLTHSAPSLDFLVSLVGADRVAYGSDFPFDMGGPAFVEQTAGVGLDHEAAALVAGGNARRLFRLRERVR